MIRVQPQTTSTGVESRVRDEITRQLFRMGPITVTTSVLVALLLAGLMRTAVTLQGLLLWAGFFAAVTIARYVMFALYRRREEILPLRGWERLFCFFTLLAGASWGLTALWLFPQNSIADQFFDLVVCMGLAAGATTSLSCVPLAYTTFLFPALLPPALRMLFQPAPVAHVAGLCALLYCGAMVLIATTNHRLLRRSLRLQFVNLELAQELEALATRDTLTGLPNRLILAERLASALRRAARSVHDVAIVFVDCDSFKNVNDTLGHAAGDEYLRSIGRALQSSIREVDTVARLGGDEFIVLLERCGDKATVEQIVKRIRLRATQPLQIGGAAIEPKLSIGVSCYPGDGTDGETLIRQADEAMYAVKRSGGNSVRFFKEKPAAAIGG